MREITLNVPHFSDFEKCSSGSRTPRSQFDARLLSAKGKGHLGPTVIHRTRTNTNATEILFEIIDHNCFNSTQENGEVVLQNGG